MGTILVFLPQSVRFFGEFLSGVRRRMEPKHQLQVIDQAVTRQRLAKLLKLWSPVGCIVDGARGIGALTPAQFGGTPVVYRDRTPLVGKRALDVCQDYRANGELAAKELMRPDIRDYVFVGFHQRTNWSRKRGDGFEDFVRLNGKRIHRYEKERRTTADTAKMAQWLKAVPKPFAVFAANDFTAKEVLEALHGISVRVPNEATLLGIDNKPEICDNVSPRISSVASDFEKSGWMCADLIYEKIRNPKLEGAQRHYPTLGIIHRESTAADGCGIPGVEKAVKAIRRRSCEGLTVDDVALEMGCPRRTAQYRFRKLTGQSIKDAILETRLQRAETLLKNRALSVREVALACGYRSDTALRLAYKAKLNRPLRRKEERAGVLSSSSRRVRGVRGIKRSRVEGIKSQTLLPLIP